MSESWLHRVRSFVERLDSGSPSERRHATRRTYWRLAIAVLVLGGVIWQVSRHGEGWQILGLRVPSLLVPTAILGTLAYVAFAVAWARLRGRGESWIDVGGPWFASLLARYAPGGVWQPAMRVLGHRLEGDHTGRELSRFLSEQALACFSCSIIALASTAIAPLPVAVLSALLGLALATPIVILVASRHMSSMSWTAGAIVWTAVGHLLLAAAVATFARAMLPLSLVDLATIGRDFLVAGVAGLLVPLVPAGLGVREVAFVWLSVPYITSAEALTIALGARVALFGCEILAYGAWLAAARWLAAPGARRIRVRDPVP